MTIEPSQVHGAVVADVYPAPEPLAPAMMAFVTWSGGSWGPHHNFPLQHYRDGQWQSERSVRGVSRYGAFKDYAIHVSLDPDNEIRAGDVLVFGEGTYTRLDVADHGLSLGEPAAVQLPDLGLSAVLIPGPPAELYVFHPTDQTVPSAERLTVVRRNQRSWLEPARASATPR